MNEKVTGNADLPYKYTSKEMDAETGLYYYGARYYDARTSRWISTDPILEQYLPMTPISDKEIEHNKKLPGMGGVFNSVNLNVYHYAGNNPVKYIDPDGKASSFKVLDDLYIFSADNDTLDGVLKASYGFIPFIGDSIYEGIWQIFGFKIIDKNDAFSRLKGIASPVLDTISQADKLAKIVKLSGNAVETLKSIGRVAGVLSAILTLTDMGIAASKAQDIGEDLMVERLLGRGLSANSHKGVETLYAYAKIRMGQLVKNGDVSFTTDALGSITSYSYKQEAVNGVLQELQVLRNQIGATPKTRQRGGR